MVFCFELLVSGLLFLALCFGPPAFGFPGLTSRLWSLGPDNLTLIWWLQKVGLCFLILFFRSRPSGPGLLTLGYLLALVLRDCVPRVLFVAGMVVLLDRGVRVPRMVDRSWWRVHRVFLSLSGSSRLVGVL